MRTQKRMTVLCRHSPVALSPPKRRGLVRRSARRVLLPASLLTYLPSLLSHSFLTNTREVQIELRDRHLTRSMHYHSPSTRSLPVVASLLFIGVLRLPGCWTTWLRGRERPRKPEDTSGRSVLRTCTICCIQNQVARQASLGKESIQCGFVPRLNV